MPCQEKSMHDDEENQFFRSPDLTKKWQPDETQPSVGAAVLEAKPDTPTQIIFNVGFPAWLGATAGLLGAGAALGPALAVGFLSGLTFYFVRSRSQT
jgi:hypothetical protein